MKAGWSLFVALMMNSVLASEQPHADVIASFTNHLMTADYPELFGEKPYRTRVQNIVVADVDNDGADDLIVHYQPHFRQSATIQFYLVDKDKTISHVIEGLAPGPLLPVSGDYLDSHELSDAVDFSLPGAMKAAVRDRNLLAKTLTAFPGLVAYDSFFHGDLRSGRYFIDMTAADIPKGADNCGEFEFSTVAQIAVGKLAKSEKNYLAAWVGKQIHLYRIGKMDSSGFLEKTVHIIPTPENFSGFLPNSGLRYLGPDGAATVLATDSFD